MKIMIHKLFGAEEFPRIKVPQSHLCCVRVVTAVICAQAYLFMRPCLVTKPQAACLLETCSVAWWHSEVA